LRSCAAEVAKKGLEEKDVLEGKEMRGTAYPKGLPLNVARHIYVSGKQLFVLT
jgi:hypothetical protein